LGRDQRGRGHHPGRYRSGPRNRPARLWLRRPGLARRRPGRPGREVFRQAGLEHQRPAPRGLLLPADRRQRPSPEQHRHQRQLHQ
ncbi:hypothetical protein LTR94_037663, partial [Friedmanniomyces endolithicus]